MTTKNALARLIALSAICGVMAVPATADAQSARQREYDRRQQKKNEWRNIAYGAGAVGVLGLLKGDKTMGLAGLAGAAYATHRYEQDRKAQNKIKTSSYYSQRRRR